MRAPPRPERDRHATEGTLPRRHRLGLRHYLGLGRLPGGRSLDPTMQTGHTPPDHEDRKGADQEADDLVAKGPTVHSHRPSRLRISQRRIGTRLCPLPDHEEEIRKVYLPQD